MAVSKPRPVPKQGSLPQAVAVLVGVVLTLIGALSFVVTGLDDFAAHNPSEQLFGLSVNPLQNLLHLAAGLLGIMLSGRLRWSRGYGWLLLAGFGTMFAYGVLAVRQPALDVLNVDWAGNWLHLSAALAGLVTTAGPVWLGVRRVASRSRR